MRHPGLTREQLLQQSLLDPSTDILTDEFVFAENLMKTSGCGYMCVEIRAEAIKVLNWVRDHRMVPDNFQISAITGCSRRNANLRHFVLE